MGTQGQHPKYVLHNLLRLNGALIVLLKYRIKASARVTLMAFGIHMYRGKSNNEYLKLGHVIGKVCIFLPTLFHKNHRNMML